MKKVLVVAVCVLGIISFSSCKGTKDSCGLAENLQQDIENTQDADEMLFI